MCPHWGDLGINKAWSPEQLRDELTTDEVKSIIEDFAASHPRITLSGGGETLLHPGLTELVSFVKGKGLYCKVVTNGTLLESYASDLVAAGVDRIDVSVDGPLPVNDAIRGIDGCFARLSAGVLSVIAERKERQNSKPLVYLCFTISSLNSSALEEMVSVAEDHRVTGLTFFHLRVAPEVVMEEYREFMRDHLPFLSPESSYWEHFPRELMNIDTEVLIHTISRIKHGEHEVLVDFQPDLTPEQTVSYYDGTGRPPGAGGGRCLTPWSALLVAPNGDVYHCYDIVVGNVRREAASRIWNNQRSRHYRKTLKEFGPTPICHRCPPFYTWY
jgi:MoaA/NifB/PqqE/SkfB family radical SAM enzyme